MEPVEKKEISEISEENKEGNEMESDFNNLIGEKKENGPAFSSQVSYSNQKGSSFKTLVLFLILLIILGVGGFYGWRYFNRNIAKPAQVNPAPLVSPTPAPTRSLNRAEWSFEVLNGSGVTGAAKVAADNLTGLGYVVVKTGNADKSNYTKNELFVREGKSADSNLILADLKTDFSIASVSGELTEGTASARLIIGSK